MPPAVTRDDLGAWLLKANPTVWDLAGFLAAGERKLTSWAVQRGYRGSLMAPGDPVLFWVSGDGRQGLDRGLWGSGYVIAPAEDWVDAEPGRWRSTGAREALRRRVEVDITVWDEPVTAAELRNHGVLDLEVQRMAQGANPSFLTRAQRAVVDELLPAWPTYQARP